MSIFEILLLLVIAIYICMDFYFGYTNRKIGLKDDSIQSLSTQCINLNNELIKFKNNNENLYIRLVSVTKEKNDLEEKLKKTKKEKKTKVEENTDSEEKD